MSSSEKNNNDLQVILVRPGATDLDLQGRITGTLNIPLSDCGEKQARETAEALRDTEVDIIYTAPCMAAQESARLISQVLEIKVKVDENLMNLDHGLWHGKLIKELKSTQPRIYRQWHENPDSVCPPGGETVTTVRERVARSVKKIRRKHKHGRIVIVVPEPLGAILLCELVPGPHCDIFKAASPFGGWHQINVPSNAAV